MHCWQNVLGLRVAVVDDDDDMKFRPDASMQHLQRNACWDTLAFTRLCMVGEIKT